MPPFHIEFFTFLSGAGDGYRGRYTAGVCQPAHASPYRALRRAVLRAAQCHAARSHWCQYRFNPHLGTLRIRHSQTAGKLQRVLVHFYFSIHNRVLMASLLALLFHGFLCFSTGSNFGILPCCQCLYISYSSVCAQNICSLFRGRGKDALRRYRCNSFNRCEHGRDLTGSTNQHQLA